MPGLDCHGVENGGIIMEYEIVEYKKYEEDEILPLYKSVGWTS